MKLFAVSMNSKPSLPGSDIIEQNYIKYLNEFGIQPILIPNISNCTINFLSYSRVSGVILTGGTDINESVVSSKLPQRKQKCIGRDAIEWSLLEYSVEKGLPVLGICRGMQFINIFFGGGLTYNISKKLPNCINHVACDHKVTITQPEFEFYLGYKHFKVNSYHNHGVTDELIAPDLREFARSTMDSIVEGLFHPALPVIGIQWHPERRNSSKRNESNLINGFFKTGIFGKGDK